MQYPVQTARDESPKNVDPNNSLTIFKTTKKKTRHTFIDRIL